MCTCMAARMMPSLISSEARGTEDVPAGAAGDLPGEAEGDVLEAEGDGVAEGQLDLARAPQRPQDAEVRDQPVLRPDEGDGLLGGEVAVLVERAQGRELVAGTVEPIEVRPADVHVPGRHVDDQGGRGGVGDRFRPEVAKDHLADHPFDIGAICRPLHAVAPVVIVSDRT